MSGLDLDGIETLLGELDRIDGIRHQYGDEIFGINDLVLRRTDLRTLVARVRELEATVARVERLSRWVRDNHGRHIYPVDIECAIEGPSS